MKAKPKTFKLDIFKVLRAIDTRKYTFYQNLTDEERKSFAAIVILRWLSVVSDENKELCEYYLQATNDLVNVHFWHSEITKHPELQYLLLSLCGIGAEQRHTWIKGPINKKKTSQLIELVRRYYPTANNNEIEFFLRNNSTDDIIQLAKDFGYQNDEIKAIKKEIKDRV